MVTQYIKYDKKVTTFRKIIYVATLSIFIGVLWITSNILGLNHSRAANDDDIASKTP